jgi:hypothetical protein
VVEQSAAIERLERFEPAPLLGGADTLGSKRSRRLSRSKRLKKQSGVVEQSAAIERLERFEPAPTLRGPLPATGAACSSVALHRE